MLALLVLSLLTVGFSYGEEEDLLDRIINGTSVGSHRYPYQLSLEQKRYGSFMHRCGAAIISEWWALTAAHCVSGKAPEDFQLRSGSIYLGEGEIHKVTEVIVHENYSAAAHDFDIALLQVSTPFKRSTQKGVKAISLATETPVPGSTATITGWGNVELNGANSRELLKAKILILDPIICQYEYPEHIITENMLCAAAKNYGKDSCQGDSGGPLVVDGKLAGIISWAEGCGEMHRPGVNTDVAVLRNWIVEHANLDDTENDDYDEKEDSAYTDMDVGNLEVYNDAIHFSDDDTNSGIQNNFPPTTSTKKPQYDGVCK